jgi:hypothetical protein
MKILKAVLILTVFTIFTGNVFAQRIMLGPRVTGNYNTYNQKNFTLSYNGIGIGAGGQLDILFNKTIGIMVNVNAFDMKGISNSTTTNNQTTDNDYSITYTTIEPMFQANFSGFFMTAGPSLGFKLAGSGEQTVSATGVTPQVTALNVPFKSTIFGITLGTGYNIKVSPDMAIGTDFMVNIPLSDTFDFPGTKNTILSLKLGASLKFKI